MTDPSRADPGRADPSRAGIGPAETDPQAAAVRPAADPAGAVARHRPSRVPWRRGSRLRRRLSSALALVVALGVVGIAYSTVATAAAPKQAAASGQPASADVRAGRQLYEVTCITCHGKNLEGVPGRGPSLIGVGQAAVYFQVITGRMPLSGQDAQGVRKPPRYDSTDTLRIAAYVQSVGGGPVLPQGNLHDGNLVEGGELFRLNCASCHGAVGRGGALSAGKFAPSLNVASDEVMYTAMLTGPQNMPVFSDHQITPEQKRAIINYVQTIKSMRDPGGSGIGRLGAVPEGLVIWIVGIGGLMLVILWIGAKT